jgi:NAD(P) transhydrogenase subunit beta
MSNNFFGFAYLIAALFFIYGLKGLSSPRTAVLGNASAMCGMVLAILIVLLDPEITKYSLIFIAIGCGAAIGIVVARKVKMTAMPQLVAALHSFVGITAILVSLGTYLYYRNKGMSLSLLTMVELLAGTFVGAITFAGSIIAFGKLQGILSGAPLRFKFHHLLNLVLTLSVLALSVHFVIYHQLPAYLVMIALSLILGVLLVTPIGGADMPVVISMHNSYSGWAAVANGFVLNNQLLIATGALVGSSGAILSYIMCKAMNRELSQVMSGGVGSKHDLGKTVVIDAKDKDVKAIVPEDAAFLLENAENVIIVPGYGMAIAQAHHAIKDLYEILSKKNVKVRFAIHPVAGRMPGHMNVLLAESDIPYEAVCMMEDINSEFSSTDVALIVGANDVTNPAAHTVKGSPLYGMPILEAFKAKNIIVCKRSMNAGYSGMDNPMFYAHNCSLLFGDAKNTCELITKNIREA